MKPNFDLKNPLVKQAMDLYRIQITKALEVSQRVESAVFPIYFPLKSLKPQQIGSGVAVRIRNEYFIFSASHVFDDIGSYALLVGLGGGERLAQLAGDRFSTKKGASGSHRDDPVDASVFHIQSELPERIRAVALSIEDFDTETSASQASVFLASGFRSSKSKTIGNNASGKRECFPSIEYKNDIYSTLGLNPDIYLALAYEDQVLMDGAWQTSPSPKGLSGGAIIRVKGIDLRPPYSIHEQPRQLLSAITIEQRREKGGRPGCLIGTRIGVHLNLIDRYLPDLFEKDGPPGEQQ